MQIQIGYVRIIYAPYVHCINKTMKHLNLYINAYTYYTFYYEIIKRGGQNFSTTIIHTHAEPIKLTFLCVPAGIYIIQYTIHVYTTLHSHIQPIIHLSCADEVQRSKISTGDKRSLASSGSLASLMQRGKIAARAGVRALCVSVYYNARVRGVR